MNNHRITFIFILLFFSMSLFAQEKFTISGYIQDKESGERLIGAMIYDTASNNGTLSNEYGFFSLTLPKDSVLIVIEYIGYERQTRKLFLDNNIELEVELNISNKIGEIVIEQQRSEGLNERLRLNNINIPITEIIKMPALFGETDILKVIQMLPGVKSGTEGASGFYVRGGSSDQNLILLDGIPVYNVSHLFGFFSVFNPDAIKNVELIKDGFPARYGGRLSSVLDIAMKEGNMKELHCEGTIGLISSKFTIEGPIKKDKTSFIFSARRTYADLIIKPFLSEKDKVGYFFYDVNAKINHKISEKSRIYLSWYRGKDDFYYNDNYNYIENDNFLSEKVESGINWGNNTLAFRWNYQFNEKLFANASLNFSNYKINIDQKSKVNSQSNGVSNKTEQGINFSSGIRDYGAKVDFNYLPSSNHYIRFGLNTTHHTFTPGVSAFNITDIGQGSFDTSLTTSTIFAQESAIYIEDEIKLAKSLILNPGVRVALFQVGNVLYPSYEPRIATKFLLSKSWAIKASFARMQQNIHLLTNSTIGLPNNLWLPATERIKPEVSRQVSGGISKSYKGKIHISLEGYYKQMDNLIEYKEGASFLGVTESWEDKVETGKGWSYGGEIYIQKKKGSFTGWIGYTLSWTYRQFSELNFGEVFPYKYDRRHDLSIVLNKELNKLWSFSTIWVYGTGNAMSMPVSKFDVPLLPYGSPGQIQEVEYFDKRNNFRAANYHRFDIAFKRTKEHKWGTGIWTFSIYNVYNRRNPFFYYFKQDEMHVKRLTRVSLFPVLPSVNYTFKF